MRHTAGSDSRVLCKTGIRQNIVAVFCVLFRSLDSFGTVHQHSLHQGDPGTFRTKPVGKCLIRCIFHTCDMQNIRLDPFGEEDHFLRILAQHDSDTLNTPALCLRKNPVHHIERHPVGWYSA